MPLARPTPLPRRRRRKVPLWTTSPRSLRRLRMLRPDPLKVKSRLSARARIPWFVKFKTRILSVKSSSSAKSKRPSRPKFNNFTPVSTCPTSANASALKACTSSALSSCATSSANASGPPNLTAKLLLLANSLNRTPEDVHLGGHRLDRVCQRDGFQFSTQVSRHS